jgi:hypothetical protein
VKGVKTFVGVPSIVIGWFAGTEMTVSWPGASGLCEKEVARNRKQHNTNRADIDRFVISHEASLLLDTQFPWLAAAFARRPTVLNGHEGGNPGYKPRMILWAPRQRPTLPASGRFMFDLPARPQPRNSSPSADDASRSIQA